MNILLVCHRVPWPLNDGGNIAMYRMAEMLAAGGHQVTLFALNTKKHYVREDSLSAGSLGRFHPVTVPIDTSLRAGRAFINLFRADESYNVVRFFDTGAAQRLKEVLRSQRFDIVQFESTFTLPYLETVRRHSSAICILRSHNVEHLIWERLAAESGNPLRRSYLRLLARRLRRYEETTYGLLDAILPITDTDAAIIRKSARNIPLRTVPLGIDPSAIAVQNWKPGTPLRLFHLGSMDWQPNIEGVKWLLEAIWPKIHRRFPDLELYLAGRSFPEHMMHTPVPGVIFSGTVPDATAFMEDKAVMLVPLRSGSGMRVKILQGLAAGKTVISTTVGAEGIDAVPGREILLADTPEEFLDRIAYCVDQPAECRAVGKAGRKLTEEKYSDRAISEKLFDFYKQLLEGQLSMRMV